MKGAEYFTGQLTLFGECEPPQEGDTRVSSSGKTCPEHSAVTREWTFEPLSSPSQRPTFQCLEAGNGRPPEWCEARNVMLHGGSSTLNFGEFPSEEKESFLSQILEPPDAVQTKYYLSAKACQGIIRRAETRKKELPPELKAALEKQVGDS